MSLELSVELSETLTWGELIAFVDAARPYVQSKDTVDIAPVENETEWIPERLRAELPSMTPTATVIDHEQARNFRAALQAVIDNNGDARIVLGELTKLRDVLT